MNKEHDTGRITVFVDGAAVEVSEHLTILLALLKEQIDVPHLCYDVTRKIRTGNCCKCIVELIQNGQSRDVRACEIQVQAGMVINIHTPRLDQLRKGPKRIGLG